MHCRSAAPAHSSRRANVDRDHATLSSQHYYLRWIHRGSRSGDRGASAAVDETVTLLHPPLPLVGVSIVMERERQQNDSLVND